MNLTALNVCIELFLTLDQLAYVCMFSFLLPSALNDYKIVAIIMQLVRCRYQKLLDKMLLIFVIHLLKE
jgi:hypothetical protein